MDIPYIKLYYGPYEYNGIIRHRPQRLHGIIQCLTKLGYEIEIIPSIHKNRLVIEMMGRTVFRCNLLNLPFNLDCDDATCKRAIEAVREMGRRMYAYDNIPHYIPKSRGMRVVQEIEDAQHTSDHFTKGTFWFEIPKPVDPKEEFAEYSFPYTHLE